MHETLAAGTADRGWTPQPLSSRIFVRCYGSYQEARQAYDRLRVIAHIPDKRMTIVARGLEWYEPLRAGQLLKLGALCGGVVGATSGLLLWALGLADGHTGWLAATVVGAVMGALAAAALALALGWVTREHADVPETGHVAPSQYDILVEEELAPAAREILAAEASR
jgi:hypothetical protein